MVVLTMIGRQAERAQILAALDAGRTLQLVGPPGIGKSTLARAAVEGRTAFFLSLETLAPDRLLDAAARALGVALDRAAVKDALAALDVLVLDGAEGVSDALPDLLELRRGATLVTTRTRLPFGEVLDLGPLPAAEALAVFQRRAAELGAAEALAIEPDAVRALVARLEGWPLALELAASRMRLFSPAELLDSPTLPVLTDRTRGPRHSSLAVALDASFSLLSDADRGALGAVSRFRGAFDVEDFQTVAAAGLDALRRLLDASLLHRRATGVVELETGALRMLAPIRELAASLPPDPQADARYAEAILSRAEAAAHRAERSDARSARDELSRLTPDLEGLLGGPPPVAARAALALATLARARGPLELAIRWLDGVPRESLSSSVQRELDVTQADLGMRAFQGAEPLALLSRWPRSPTTTRLTGMAQIRIRDLTAAIQTLEEAVELADAAPLDRLGRVERAYSRFSLGAAWMQHGQTLRAARLLREAREHVESADDPDLEGLVSKFLSLSLRDLGEPVERRLAIAAHAVELHRRTGNLRLQAMALNMLAETQLDAQSPDAEATLVEGDAVARRAGLRSTIHQILLLRALDALGVPDPAAARAHLDQLVEPFPHMRNWIGVLSGLADLHDGDRAAAVEAVEKGLAGAIAQEIASDALLFRALRALMGNGAAPEMPAGLPPTAPVAVLCGLAERVSGGRALEPGEIEQASGFVEVRAFVTAAQVHIGTRVAVDGSWFQVHGHERVELGRRRVLKRVLAALLGRPEGIDQKDLLALGWPGESPTLSSGRARVHVAVGELRKMGLRDVLETIELGGEGGYILHASPVEGRGPPED